VRDRSRSRTRKPKTPPPAERWRRIGKDWECPACGKQFVQAGLRHSCTIVPLEAHFHDRPEARKLFDAYRAAIEQEGPVRLSVAKTRIGFITRMTFAAVMPRKSFLRTHFLLRRRAESRRFTRVDYLPPYWVHVLKISDVTAIDEEVRAWLREAYRLGSETPGTRGRP
jgi:hypothetical protein